MKNRWATTESRESAEPEQSYGQATTSRPFRPESVPAFPSLQLLPARTRKQRTCPGATAVVLSAMVSEPSLDSSHVPAVKSLASADDTVS